MFAKISHIDDLLPHIKDNTNIRVRKEPNGFTIVCYMVQNDDLFQNEFQLECRGITFSPDGKIAARCLHKFFNVGERQETLADNIDWFETTRIMPKFDGSMVTPVLDGDKVIFKTKKTFDSREALFANQLVALSPERTRWIAQAIKLGLTPTFELTSPRFPIVIAYDKDELTLLHVREMVSGEYIPAHDIEAMEPPFPVAKNLIDDFSVNALVDWHKLKQTADELANCEGWVIQFDSGKMVKLKTAWYNKLHVSVTFTRWRDIAECVLNDSDDDLKAAFALTGRSIEPIATVKSRILDQIDSVKTYVNNVVNFAKNRNYTQKEVAINNKDDVHFGLIMTTFSGKDVDWFSWYKKKHLQDWSLEVVNVFSEE